MDDFPEEHTVMSIAEDNEKPCWGCGSRLLLPSYAPIFKCGWCGAITNQKELKCENKYFWCRRLRDRCFVCVLLSFMLFIICGGVWAVYPVLFSINYFCGVVHSLITIILSLSTILTFSLAAFRCAGTPPIIPWGSYPVVGKGHLENYKFCQYCSKPKPPRAHHCRSCEMCILDMDHHCPFIGNCVGAANHRHFIAFLISTVISTIYVAIMSAFAVTHMWPPVTDMPVHIATGGGDDVWAWRTLKEITFALLRSALLLSPRGLLLVYLFMASVSVNIGLSVLLWQQLCYVYEGQTYLGHLASQGSDEPGERDCKNLLRFFGCPYTVSRFLPIVRNSQKRHNK